MDEKLRTIWVSAYDIYTLTSFGSFPKISQPTLIQLLYTFGRRLFLVLSNLCSKLSTGFILRPLVALTLATILPPSSLEWPPMKPSSPTMATAAGSLLFLAPLLNGVLNDGTIPTKWHI